MPVHVVPPILADQLAGATGPLVGMWVCSGSPLVAEICAGSGVHWLLFDAEHSPNEPAALLAQLQAVAAYPVTPVVRLPSADVVLVKQLLDIGAQSLLVPMIETPVQAAQMAAAVRYPPRGVRGVGSALARASRWNRVERYLDRAAELVSLTVQIESAAGVAAAGEIAAVDGVDALYAGPADLAASLGRLGRPEHPTVVAAVEAVIAAGRAAGKPVGVNAFDPQLAEHYLDAGAAFLTVGADVSLLARGSEELARRHPRSATR